MWKKSGPSSGGPQGQGGQGGSPSLDANGNQQGAKDRIYTFSNAPVPIKRQPPVAFTLPNGKTHWYEAVYLPKGGINWVQCKALAEEAGGYMVTLHSDEENDFVFSLIEDEKFWFKWDSSHNYVMNGPFIGGFKPKGSPSGKSGWKWVSGEPWDYSKWCRDGLPGDRDPRPNNQPNDSTGNSDIIAYGEINVPVKYWGDFPHKFSSYNDTHEGGSYGFIIEYESKP